MIPNVALSPNLSASTPSCSLHVGGPRIDAPTRLTDPSSSGVTWSLKYLESKRMRTDGSGGQAGGGRHQRNRTQTKGGAIHIRPRVVGFNAYTISKFVRGILGRSRPAQTAVVGRGAGGIPCETPSTPTHLRHFSLGSMICHRFFQFFRRWPRFHSHPERANRLPPPVLLAAELSAPLISIMIAQTCIVCSH